MNPSNAALKLQYVLDKAPLSVLERNEANQLLAYLHQEAKKAQDASDS